MMFWANRFFLVFLLANCIYLSPFFSVQISYNCSNIDSSTCRLSLVLNIPASHIRTKRQEPLIRVWSMNWVLLQCGWWLDMKHLSPLRNGPWAQRACTEMNTYSSEHRRGLSGCPTQTCCIILSGLPLWVYLSSLDAGTVCFHLHRPCILPGV